MLQYNKLNINPRLSPRYCRGLASQLSLRYCSDLLGLNLEPLGSRYGIARAILTKQLSLRYCSGLPHIRISKIVSYNKQSMACSPSNKNVQVLKTCTLRETDSSISRCRKPRTTARQTRVLTDTWLQTPTPTPFPRILHVADRGLPKKLNTEVIADDLKAKNLPLQEVNHIYKSRSLVAIFALVDGTGSHYW